jgi:hypothetical protein
MSGIVISGSLVYDIFILTVIFEVITLIGRFGFGVRANESPSIVQKLTIGYRVHHSYLGILLFPVGYFSQSVTDSSYLLMAMACALVLSDTIHHFLVLWPYTGDHEFTARYDE